MTVYLSRVIGLKNDEVGGLRMSHKGNEYVLKANYYRKSLPKSVYTKYSFTNQLVNIAKN